MSKAKRDVRKGSVRIGIGILIVLFLIVIGVYPHLVTHYGPFQADSMHMKDFTIPPFPPSRMHLFGTDESGHDLFTQVVYGIIPTLRDATILVFVSLVLAVVVAVIQVMYNVRITLFDRLSYVTSLFPPVLLALLVLEMHSVYFSRFSQYWYYGVIGLLEIGRFIPIVEGDIRLIYQKPFIEAAVVSGGSQTWIFRKHVFRWMVPYFLEYVPTQYARVLAVMGELGYFGVVTKAMIFASQDGVVFATRQLDIPTLIAEGGHHWFTVPQGVLFPTIGLCIMIVSFRLLSAGFAQAAAIERVQHWPWKQKRFAVVRSKTPLGSSVGLAK